MTVTNFIWDELSDNVLLETDESDALTARYTNRPEQFGKLLSQYRIEDEKIVERFYHYDGESSTRDLTDSDENVTDTFIYTAYGEEVARTGTTTNPFGYKGAVGYYTNEETNDIYVRNRTYEPAMGCWLSADPLGFVDGPNRYRAYFVPGKVDPTGLLEHSCTCSHTVELNSACVPPTAPEDIPWSRADFSPRPKREIFGETRQRRTIDCEECIMCPDGRWKLRGPCTVTIEFHFLFDTIAILKYGRDFSRLYGHEQRHVINYKNCFRDVVMSAEVQEQANFSWSTKDICEETGPGSILIAIKDGMQPCFACEGSHDNRNPNYVPADNRPYDPIGTVPGNPVPVPDWIPDPNWDD